MMKQHNYAFEDAAAKRFLRLARQFENLAETYREVHLHGPANDAEAWKSACEFQAAHTVRAANAVEVINHTICAHR